MKLLTVAALSAAVLVGGCGGGDGYGARWQRSDGRPVDESFDWAMSRCRGAAQQYEEGAVQAMRRCMARRGYVWTD